MAFTTTIIPAINNTYQPLVPVLCDVETQQAIVIDPCEGEPILDHLQERGCRLTHILVTHHHSDHTGGIEALQRALPKPVPVYAHPRYASRIPHFSMPLNGGQTLDLEGLQVRVLETPGHTIDHLAFWIPSLREAFLGDSVSRLGVGRLHEGSPVMLWSTISKIKMLPPQTILRCGHDYLFTNAHFTLSVDPAHTYAQDVAARPLSRTINTTPSLLEDELLYNLFFRADDPRIAELLGIAGASAIEVTAVLRGLRDEWKGPPSNPTTGA